MKYSLLDAVMCRALWEAMRRTPRKQYGIEAQSPICRRFKSNVRPVK